MHVGWLSIAAAFAVFIHHYHVHGRFYDPSDLRNLKFRSHEFWMVFLTLLGLVMLAIE